MRVAGDRGCDEPERAGRCGSSRRCWPGPRSGRWRCIRSSTAGAGSSTAGSRSGAACRRAWTWPGSAWPTWPRSALVPGRGRRPALPARAGRHRSSRWPPAWPASTPAGHLAEGKFFAMGSGPMRAAPGQRADLRADRLPRGGRGRRRRARRPEAAAPRGRGQGRRGLPASRPGAVTLLIAPTASLAGGLQVVARSVETALHKLAELGFDLARIVSAHGIGPAAAGRRATTWPRSAGPTTRSSTGPGSSCSSPATTTAWRRSARKVPSSSLARSRRAVRRDLRPLQPRLLRGRSPPVQPGGGRLPEPRDRPRPRLRPDGARCPRPLVLRLSPDFPDEPLSLAQDLRESPWFSRVFARFLPS